MSTSGPSSSGLLASKSVHGCMKERGGGVIKIGLIADWAIDLLMILVMRKKICYSYSDLPTKGKVLSQCVLFIKFK